MPPDRTEIIVVAPPCACVGDLRIDPDTGECVACGGLVADGASVEVVDFHLAPQREDRFQRRRDPAAPDPLIGQQLGHFRIMSRLGIGGMGAVYRAMDESLQRYVALKVIDDPEADDDGRRVARLLQEARAQARVNHANVVHIYYVSRNEQQPFLAMELVHGATLADRLREGPLPFAEIIEIALQTVEALRQASLFDIVHGDIKPGNILLSDGATVKLSDFGLAQRLSQTSKNPDRLAGTPNYLSPEACRGQATDIRSDMYALGVMLFEMTFGRLPYTFVGEHANARIRAHCSGHAEFPERWPAHLPEEWKGLLERLLAKEPCERFWTYDLLLDDLHALRPVARPQAGRLVRTIAWIVDITLVSAIQRFIIGLFAGGAVGAYLSGRPGMALLASLSGFTVPAVVMYLQSLWRMSPGKELLQIRIVDVHGLAPQSGRLALRSLLAMLPIWHFALQAFCDAAGVPVVGKIAGFATLAVVAVDALFGLFRRDCRTL
ncbi:MAG: protein kinase, partial [Planctomycetaceae bacterium]|nr:protein kinase [Planctomycetaceae bacterium]